MELDGGMIFFLCVSETLQGRINLTEGPGATTRPWGPPGPHREEINLRPHRAASVITLEPKDKLTNRKASVHQIKSYRTRQRVSTK